MFQTICFENIKPHLKHLRVLGFYQIDPQSSRTKRIIHRIYMGLILYLNSMYTVQQMILIYKERDNPDKVMDTLFLMLTYSDCIWKQIILWKRQDRIEKLFEILKGPLFNQNLEYHYKLLTERGHQGKLLLRSFNITALCTCFLWVLYPMVLFSQHKHVEFAIWLPVDPNLRPQFYFVISYVWVQTSLLAIGNTSADALISFLFAQCKTQLTIIRIDLENIVAVSKKESKEKSLQFADVFHRRFKKIMLLYNEIVHVCYETQSIFGGAIFYFFVICAWIICTSAYRMVNINPISVEFWSMILYIICVLTEICLYCYYGNEVTYESQQLLQSAFAMDWHELPAKCRYSIIIFMERIKRPIIPMAGVIIPLSNNTIVSVLRSSYSFYAFLKNTE